MPRVQPVEIFTTNYDVLIETAFKPSEWPRSMGSLAVTNHFFLTKH